MLRRQPLRQWVQPIGEDSALRREAVTMGFYTCVTLFAALAAGNDDATQQSGELLALIWISTVGLALAHWLAATTAIQLVRDTHAKHSTAEYLTAHLLPPSIAAASASLVVLIVPNDVKLLAGRLTQRHSSQFSSPQRRDAEARRRRAAFALHCWRSGAPLRLPSSNVSSSETPDAQKRRRRSQSPRIWVFFAWNSSSVKMPASRSSPSFLSWA